MHLSVARKQPIPVLGIPAQASLGQRGLVLVIGLLFLLVLAVVGSASMNSTVMAEKMASNNQYKTVAFQIAESAIERHWSAELFERALNEADAGYEFSINLGREFDPVSNGPVRTTAQADIRYCGERAAEGTGMNADQSLGVATAKLHAVDVVGRGDVSNISAVVVHQRRGGFLGPSINIRHCEREYE